MTTVIMEYHNLVRLIIWYDTLHCGYRWRVSELEGGEYWLLGESRGATTLDTALMMGRIELDVWSERALKMWAGEAVS